MFDRYSIASTASAIKDRFKVDPTESYEPIYNAHPTSLLPVITDQNPDGLSFFYWGMPPAWSKNKSVSRRLINANISELTTRKTYQTQLNSRRCVVLADGLYGWKKISKKGQIPYRFILNNEEPFLMAGIWDEFDNKDGSVEHVFTIITTDAEDELVTVFDQSPIRLLERHVSDWLNSSQAEDKLIDMLKAADSSPFGNYPVTNRINDPEYQGSDLLKAAPPIDQFGNYSLFD